VNQVQTRKKDSICPLILIAELISSAILDIDCHYKNANCLKGDCEWFDGDLEACSIWAIKSRLEDLA